MQLRVNSFDLLVMLAVLRLGEQAYGIAIRDEMVRGLRRADVPLGSVYAALVRLEARGWLRSRRGEATAVRGGKAKMYFEVSAKGLQEVRRSRQTLINFWEGVPQLN